MTKVQYIVWGDWSSVAWECVRRGKIWCASLSLAIVSGPVTTWRCRWWGGSSSGMDRISSSSMVRRGALTLPLIRLAPVWELRLSGILRIGDGTDCGLDRSGIKRWLVLALSYALLCIVTY